MKKKILSIAIVAAIAVAAAWSFNQSNQELALTDVALSNVEALASCETSYGGSCWLTIHYECCIGGGLGCAPCD